MGRAGAACRAEDMLQSLGLSGCCGLGDADDALQAVANYIRTSTTLTVLRLRHCGLDASTAGWLKRSQLASGLKWLKVPERPGHGYELDSPALAEALQRHVAQAVAELTVAEAEDLGVSRNLRLHHYVVGRTGFFVPATLASGERSMTIEW